MAKKDKCECPVCGVESGICKGCAIMALIVGVLFLLQDLNIWNFWGISWYTAAFLLVGLLCLIGPMKK